MASDGFFIYTKEDTYYSRFLTSPNIKKLNESFDKLINTDLFLQIHEVSKVHTFIKGMQD